MNRVKLRAFKDQDLSLFKQWLIKEHVAKWYTEPDDWIYEIEDEMMNLFGCIILL